MIEDCDVSEVLKLQSFITLIAPYGPPPPADPQTHREKDENCEIRVISQHTYLITFIKVVSYYNILHVTSYDLNRNPLHSVLPGLLLFVHQFCEFSLVESRLLSAVFEFRIFGAIECYRRAVPRRFVRSWASIFY